MTDISINIPPFYGYPYIGYFYTILATGGFNIAQIFSPIQISTRSPLLEYDLTNAIQVYYDVRIFNTKLGLIKDASNINILETAYDTTSGQFPNDTITITATEFTNVILPKYVISLGTYSTLYRDFEDYVSTYFSYPNSFASLFSTTSRFDINNGVFDASAFYNIINGRAVDNTGAYIDNLTGEITISNINLLLSFCVEKNVFANRDSSSNVTLENGFLAGDIIYVPSGTAITLSVSIANQGHESITNTGPSLVSDLTLISDFTQQYGDTKYTRTTLATTGGITRNLTAPLVLILQDLS
jgi:hypothetical protein